MGCLGHHYRTFPQLSETFSIKIARDVSAMHTSPSLLRNSQKRRKKDSCWKIKLWVAQSSIQFAIFSTNIQKLKCERVPLNTGSRLQRWSMFDADALPMSFFLAAMRCRWYWPLVTITIGAIIFSQLSGLIISWWFLQFKDWCLAMIFCGKP